MNALHDLRITNCLQSAKNNDDMKQKVKGDF